MTPDDPVAVAARATAARFAAQYGPGLQTEVELALHTRGSERKPDRYFDPIALGSLIVSIASLAWTIYNGLKSKTPNPASDVLARALRVEIRLRGDNAIAPDDEVTEVIVSEIMRAASDSG